MNRAQLAEIQRLLEDLGWNRENSTLDLMMIDPECNGAKIWDDSIKICGLWPDEIRRAAAALDVIEKVRDAKPQCVHATWTEDRRIEAVIVHKCKQYDTVLSTGCDMHTWQLNFAELSPPIEGVNPMAIADEVIRKAGKYPF